MSMEALRSHPCYDRCVRIYRYALVDWRTCSSIRNAAATLGMDRRAYCDARLSANYFQWTSADTGEEFTRAHVDAAWKEVTDGLRVAS